MTPLLSGCIAAVAAPVVGGGLIAGSSAIRGDREPDNSDQPQADDEKVSSGEVVASQDRAAPPLPSATPKPATPSPVEAEELRASTRAMLQSVREAELVPLNGPLPEPSAKAVRAPALPAPVSPSGFDSFVAHALAARTLQREGEEVEAALLSNPAALDGKRQICYSPRAGVLIDLDPKGAMFDTKLRQASHDEIAGLLATLRSNSVTIGWISGHPAAKAGAIRSALKESGLDAEGADTLVLMRYPEDRKQTRRAEFAASHCLVGIAGDTRSDFDELYRFLRDEKGAVALETLIGEGWFFTAPALGKAP
jgi:hypothetical protein